MEKHMKKAILVVSFGTSVNETREKTIDRIEADIRNANPDAAIYRAWTSKMIIRKLKRAGRGYDPHGKRSDGSHDPGWHPGTDRSADPYHQRYRKRSDEGGCARLRRSF